MKIIDNASDAKKSAFRQQKGKKLEEFLYHFFSAIDGITVTDSNLTNGFEELDLVLKNNVDGTFWKNLNSALIIVEAKNWVGKAPSKEFGNFESKITSHKNLCQIGFFVSVNGFTSAVDEKLISAQAKGVTIVKIGGDEIEYILKNQAILREWIEEKISRSIKIKE